MITEIDGARLNQTLDKIQALVRDEKAAGVPVMVTFAVMLALINRFCSDEDDEIGETIGTLAEAIEDDMQIGEALH